MNTFDIQSFAAEVKTAMDNADDRQAAARGCLERALATHGSASIIATLQAAVPAGATIGEMIVYADAELTLLFARMPPRFQSGIHDHTVFACIAQLEGSEVNTVYRANGDGLDVVERFTVNPGEVVSLPADVIHGITNPSETGGCALHLYGGDFRAISGERSLYDANDHHAIPFSFPDLVQQSARMMHLEANEVGLEALAQAIPAARPVVDALRAG